jgi:hypothetical protein
MKPYAYICTLCDHFASRHLMDSDATSVVEGPYLCSHNDCDCEITQTTPLRGINRAECEAMYACEAGAR